MGISDKQLAILNYLREIHSKKKAVPSISELGEFFDMSQQAMSKNLKRLEREGFIKRQKGRYRNFTIVKPEPRAIRVPLLGKIAAGAPIEAIEVPEEIDIPESVFNGQDGFALRVEGQSMIEDGIHHGDLVFVKRQTTAFNGQTVVALVNGEATLKRYYHEGDRIRLQPANQNMKPLYVFPDQDFEIRGIVVSLFRSF
ncbi:MAG: repressor LexA [Acidobacteria bacterium]|nr:MAG: repressor LexA [Acidobacteriota bacterium]